MPHVDLHTLQAIARDLGASDADLRFALSEIDGELVRTDRVAYLGDGVTAFLHQIRQDIPKTETLARDGHADAGQLSRGEWRGVPQASRDPGERIRTTARIGAPNDPRTLRDHRRRAHVATAQCFEIATTQWQSMSAGKRKRWLISRGLLPRPQDRHKPDTHDELVRRLKAKLGL